MELKKVLESKQIGEAELKVLSENKHLLSAKDLKKFFNEEEEK